MSDLAIGLTGFVALLLVLAVRVPIGVGMLAIGLLGYWSIAGTTALLGYLKTEMYWRYSSFDLSVVPMFIMMGHFAEKAGLSQALFRAANVFVGHFRGGTAMAAIGGCAGFGTISGSSLATAAMMGQVALPELRRYHYKGSLATGALAAGGTLGILIPPSIVLIIFALMVEGNIVTLFQAAFVPGILAALGYMLAIAVVVRIDPLAGPAGPRTTGAEKWAALLDIWPVLAIFLVVMGGMYGGYFTPTEAAGVGTVCTFLVAVTRGGMRLDGIIETLLATAMTTGMICLILLGADVFNAFLGFSRLPVAAVEFFEGTGLPPMTVLLGMIALYIVLGCVMDSLSMILLTSPVFWPIISGLDFGMNADDLRLWFGVITLIVVEVGLITPPVGLNVFVINSIARDVPMIDTYRGVVPFLVTDAIRVACIVMFPAIVLFLPKLLAG
ncbi:MAG: C4-dicarboxylate ABC transporter permease [Betaproteobacteria bacterium RIFCSPLOWO2_02_FULL_62_17]|nr:MAG: C4-dicarboxylate ABC transporter permease [Betaproteobacteria bacterium RIFCSPLOWO2_02_FULL_62_17]